MLLMLHWYHLARATLADRPRSSAACSPLFPDDRASPSASLSPEQRKKLFWLGLAEAAPLACGAVFSIYTHSAARSILAAVIAMLLTALICWLLRHQIPPTRIELTQTKSHDHVSREATHQA